jgi:hypothetical protein
MVHAKRLLNLIKRKRKPLNKRNSVLPSNNRAVVAVHLVAQIR